MVEDLGHASLPYSELHFPSLKYLSWFSALALACRRIASISYCIRTSSEVEAEKIIGVFLGKQPPSSQVSVWSHPSAKKLFPAHKEHYRKPQLVKMQKTCSFVWFFSPTVPTVITQLQQLKVRDHCRRGWKDRKRLKNRKFALRLCLSEKCQSSCTHEVSSAWLPTQDLSEEEDDTRQANTRQGKLRREASTLNKEPYVAKECGE